MSESRRGIVLILMSVLLVLLVGVAATVMHQMGILRQIQRSGVAMARAALLARSGVARARMEIRRGTDSVYRGEDYDGDGVQNLAPTSYETKSQVYRPTAFDIEGCPAGFALRPSFFASTPDSGLVGGAPAPAVTLVDGTHRGFSGRLRAMHGDSPLARGDTYVLRVRAEEGIYLNGGDPAAGAAVGYNGTLRRMLGTLAEALDRQTGGDDGLPVDQTDGEAIATLRPATGWLDWDRVRDVALGGSQAKLDALRPYVTLYAWVDRKVIAPNATAAMSGAGYDSWAAIRLAHQTYPSTPGTHEPTFERIPVSSGGRIVGRAPVSLSWARRNRPALIALMAGLRGLYLQEASAGAQGGLVFVGSVGTIPPAGNVVGRMQPAEIALNWGAGTDDCRGAADALVAYGGALDTWSDWHAFCDTVPFGGTADEVRAKRDILKANFCPDSDLNKFSPNASTWKTVDKSDLLVSSTEFTLFPVNPVGISSLGRVLDLQGRPLAAREVEAIAGGPSVLRLAAQSEFVCDDLGALDVAGDEGAPRMPWATPYASPSWGSVRTWGHRFPPVVSAGMANGVSLQTYPAAYADPDGPSGPTPMTISPAAYDGSIQLATIETPDNDTYTVFSPPADMKMLASFDDNLDLDVSDSALANGAANEPDILQAAVTAGLWDPSRPSTFYPDGGYSEWRRAIAYRDRGNSHGLHDTISFWVKPNYSFAVDTSANNGGWRGRRLLRRTAHDPSGAGADQLFAVAHWHRQAYISFSLTGQSNVSFMFEVGGGSTDDDDYEHRFTVSHPERPRRWYLATIYHDFQGADADATGAIARDAAGSTAGQLAVVKSYGTIGNASGAAQDITRSPVSATGFEDAALNHLLVLGVRDQRDQTPMRLGGGADMTFDEFAIWDFGQDKSAMQTLAVKRYEEGRYYRGDAYYDASVSSLPNEAAAAYFTPRISLPAGTVIRQVRWNFRRPAELPTDYAELELARTDGSGLLWASGARASDSPGWTAGMQRWNLYRAPDSDFRLRAVFLRGTALDPDVPILDSPSLEEIVVLYAPAGGTGIVSWSER